MESFTGAGMLGRQVSALGASTSLSAAEGAPLLSRIILAAGPVHVYVTPSDRVPLRVAIDAASVASIVYTATLPKAWIDVRESLSSGAVVFRRGFTEAELGYGGVQLAGVVQLTRPTDVYQDGVPVADAALRLAAHERVHVLQYDQAFILWSVPVEDRLMRGARWSRDVHRYVDVGLNAPLEVGLFGLLPYRLRPWEREAYFLSHGSPEQAGGSRR